MNTNRVREYWRGAIRPRCSQGARAARLASLCALLAGATTVKADDLAPPPWGRGANDTTFQHWNFSAGNLAVSAPDGPPDAQVANPFNMPATFQGAFLGLRPNGSAIYQPAFGGRLHVWDLAPAGAVVPGAGELWFDIPNMNQNKGKELRLQVTFFVGMANGINYQAPTLSVMDVGGGAFTRYKTTTLLLGGGWRHQLSQWILDTCPQSENVVIRQAGAAHAAIDQVVIDTKCGVPIVDGTIDALYECPVAIQERETSAGDSNNGMADVASGSELDVAYGTILDGVLYLTLAGNLKTGDVNNNVSPAKLEIFFDSKAGGQNRLLFNNTAVDGFGRMCENAANAGDGLKFSVDFEADHWIGVSAQKNAANVFELSAYYAVIGTANSGVLLGKRAAQGNGVLAGGNNANGIRVSIDNRHTDMVSNANGGDDEDNGWGAQTGIELAIPLAALGSPVPADGVKVCAFINASDHALVSNQVLDGFVPRWDPVAMMISKIGDAGDPRDLDLCNPKINAVATNWSGQRVFQVLANNQEWFRLWKAGGPEDQSKDCMAPLGTQHSGLVGKRIAAAPGYERVKDTDFALLVAQRALNPTAKPNMPAPPPAECMWAFGECYGGGMFDELNAAGGVQAGTSASRYGEPSYYPSVGGNGQDWVLRYLAGLGDLTVSARTAAAFAARHDPYGPGKDATDPARVNEDGGSENPVYFSTGANGDAIFLNSAQGTPHADPYAIIWCGQPKVPIDEDQIVAAVTLLRNNGWAANKIYVFYRGGVMNAPALNKIRMLKAAHPGLEVTRATKADLDRVVSRLFDANVVDPVPKLLFFLAMDHGYNTDPTKPRRIMVNGDGLPDAPDWPDDMGTYPPDPHPNDSYPPTDPFVCADAMAVGDGAFAFDTTAALTDGPSPCAGLGADVWFNYVSSCSGTATINTCGSSFDTVLAIYSGCACPVGAALVCNDDSCGQQSTVSFPVAAGSCYKIQLGGYNGESGTGLITLACAAPPVVNIISANPPAAAQNGGVPFRDVLENTNTALAPEGIGQAGTPAEGAVSYAPIRVTFSGTPVPAPAPGNITVSCTGGGCPTVTAVSGAGTGPYLISLSSAIPARQCTTLTFAGTAAGQKLQYQSLPGDSNLNGATSGQDVLALVTAINTNTAVLTRHDINRNGTVSGQDALRLVQLINGGGTVSPATGYNGATVAPCP